ncbi:MAG: diguanylate cyclase [Chloroflexi bacterium]|nr:diguanylate cyclase [Chloroflexota bacterium]
MLRDILDSSNYAFSAYAIPVVIAGLLNGGLGLVTLVRERASIVSVTFCVMALSTTIWLVSFGAVYSTDDPSIALAWVRVEHVGLVMIPASVFLFASAVTGHLNRRNVMGACAVPLSIVLYVLVLATDGVVDGVRRYYWGFYPVQGSLMPLLLGFFGLYLGASVYVLRAGHKATQSAAQRRRLKAILVALLISYPATVDFLPALGVAVYPVGYIFIGAFVVLAARAVWEYRLIDITPARAAEQIIDTMAEGLIVVDRDGVIRLANEAAAEMLGTVSRSLLGASVSGIGALPLDTCFDHAVDHGFEERRSEISYRRTDGAAGAAIVSASRLQHRTGEWVGTVYIIHDITDRRRAEEEMRYLAFHDPLTGVASRPVLIDRLAKAVAQARRDQTTVGLIFLDLDGFKKINDTEGHEAGDEHLRDVAEETERALRDGDTLARVGGDEFVVLLPSVRDTGEVAGVAKRILERLNERWEASVSGGRGSASLGIAAYPLDGEDAETLLRHADAAMYTAKKRGGNGYELFATTVHPGEPQRRAG